MQFALANADTHNIFAELLPWLGISLGTASLGFHDSILKYNKPKEAEPSPPKSNHKVNSHESTREMRFIEAVKVNRLRMCSTRISIRVDIKSGSDP
jgi:hypothetical protein